MLWCVCIIWQTCVICDAFYCFAWLPCSGKCLQHLSELCGFSPTHVSMRSLRLWLHASWHTSRLSSFSSICVSICLLTLSVARNFKRLVGWLVGWSLTSLLSTNTAISEAIEILNVCRTVSHREQKINCYDKTRSSHCVGPLYIGPNT